MSGLVSIGAAHVLPFDSQEFVESPSVPSFVGEASRYESAYDFACDLDSDHASTDAQHVHIVVLDALVSRVRIVAHACPDAGNLVCHQAHADGASA